MLFVLSIWFIQQQKTQKSHERLAISILLLHICDLIVFFTMQILHYEIVYFFKISIQIRLHHEHKRNERLMKVWKFARQEGYCLWIKELDYFTLACLYFELVYIFFHNYILVKSVSLFIEPKCFVFLKP